MKTYIHTACKALFLLLLALPLKAQVTPMSFTRIQWFTNTGQPCAGCLLYTYVAGTSTPQTTYSDALGTIPNSDPVVADTAGRMNVFVGSSAYKFILTSPSMVQLWSIDNVTSTTLSLLASNNTWSGSNTWSSTSTFNGTVTMTVGYTSNGPSNMTTGGSMAGTFTGSPTFSGTPNFSNGFMATTGAFSGQITSSVSTGTAPFVVASTTNVANLNASSLSGNTFPAPGAIGGTTPAAGTFTTLIANTSLSINGSTAQTGVQGTDTKLISTGASSPTTGQTACFDANGGITNSGCAAGFTSISTGTNSSVCSTTTSAGATCTTTVTISPTQANTNYIAGCIGVSITGAPYIAGVTKAVGSITVTISNGQGSQAVVSTYGDLECTAIHP